MTARRSWAGRCRLSGVSVQGRLAEAMQKFSGETVDVRGAGRTDAGVHARGQVAHVDLAKDWPPDTVRDAVNFHLKPDPVAVLACEAVGGDFDARHSAVARHYLYRIVVRRGTLALDRNRAWRVPHALDVSAMHTGGAGAGGPARLHDLPRSRMSGALAGEDARSARGDRRRRGGAHRGVGALVPASPGAVDGGQPEACGRRQWSAEIMRAALRGARPGRMRRHGAGGWAVSDAG